MGVEEFGAVLELLFKMVFICSFLGLATTGISFTENDESLPLLFAICGVLLLALSVKPAVDEGSFETLESFSLLEVTQPVAISAASVPPRCGSGLIAMFAGFNPVDDNPALAPGFSASLMK